MKTKISLSDHFGFGRMLRFTLPSIIMMIFTSIYGIVDGLFVSNIVGEEALAAINLIYPVPMIIGAFGFMLGTGGSAQVARTLGEGDNEQARRYFSSLVLTIVAVGAFLTVLCVTFMRPLSVLLGAEGDIVEDCVLYGSILTGGSVAFMLQSTFHAFFVVAEKPKLGLIITVSSGLTNILLDYLFVAVFRLGLQGAALATVCGYCVGGLIPLLYFLLNRRGLLYFVRTRLYGRMLLASCSNGMSEMVSNISMAITTVLFNLQMLRLVGSEGVSAITVIMYLGFVFVAVLIGFSMGISPVVGFHFGARNRAELKSLFRKSMTIVAAVSVLMLAFAEGAAELLTGFFLKNGTPLWEMTVHGLRLYGLSTLLAGLNIFASAFFTALCNGRISAIISFLRSLLLQVVTLLVLPQFLGLDGVWLALPATELLSALVSVAFLLTQRKKYGYAGKEIKTAQNTAIPLDKK